MDIGAIPESTVEFTIFPIEELSRTCLEQKRHDYMQYLSPWILRYPWFKEIFSIKNSTIHQTRFHLSGCVNFGESVEDEWFVVWLLVQISQIDPSVVIQVRDEDGQFLLIEAADQLPSWLSPDNADNRVWIHKGLVCVIQLDTSERLSIADSLNIFAAAGSDMSAEILSSDGLQSAVAKRIHGYPERIESIKHTTHVTLSYPAAAVLSVAEHDSLVRSALSTWATYHNDPTMMRSWRNHLKTNSTLFCQAVQTRDREEVGESNPWPQLRSHVLQFVICPCTLSRVHYAKWRSLPTPTAIQFPENSGSSSNRLSLELGLKLCAGLDIMLIEARTHLNNHPSFDYRDKDPSSCSSWSRYLSRLNAMGYFRNELPGSRLHNELSATAKEFFIVNILREPDQSNQPGENSMLSQMASLLYQIVTKIERNLEHIPSVEEFRARERSLQPPDDDSWLYITPDQLDEMLAERSGIKPIDFDNVNEDQKPISLVEMLDNFVGSTSSYEGVELGAVKLGGKRKCTAHNSGGDVLTDDEGDGQQNETSSSESEQWDLVSEDSEDGFTECGPADTSLKAEESLNMYDIMRSLLSTMDDPLGLRTKQSTRSTLNKSSIVSKTDVDALFSSDSGEDELLDLYGPNTDGLADYAGSSSPSSLSEDDFPYARPLQRGPKQLDQSNKPVMSSSPRKEREMVADLLPVRDAPRTNGITLDWCQPSYPRQFPGSEAEQTMSKPPLIQSQMSQSHTEAEKHENTPMHSFYAQMEKELAGQPANIGRLTELIAAQDREIDVLGRRGRRGLSGRKKIRPNPRHARLAHAEEFESDDSDDSNPQMGTSSDRSQLNPSSLPPTQELSDHVMRNLYASIVPPGSEPQPPTGPAAQLFAALGIPVNQLSSVEHTISGNQ